MPHVCVSMRDEVATTLAVLAKRNGLTKSGMLSYLVMQAAEKQNGTNAQQLLDLHITPPCAEDRA